MLIPFAPIITLCVLLQSLLLQSLDYQTASDAFHLGGYFLLGSNTAYILTGRMTLLDGLLDVRYIEFPVTPYSKSSLQSSPVPHPMRISSHAWSESTPPSTPSRTAEASATTVPTVVDASPALNLHPLESGSNSDPDEAISSVVEPPSSASATSGDITASVTPAILSNESRSTIGDGLNSRSRPFLSLRSLVGRALDSQHAGLIALAISAAFGLLAVGTTLRVVCRPLASQPRKDLAECAGCGHEDMLPDVRWLLNHLGADKNVSLAEFCRSIQVVDATPVQENRSRAASPSLGTSSSFATLAHSPLAHKRAVRKRIPVFNVLPTPDPSGAGKWAGDFLELAVLLLYINLAGQQSSQSRPGPEAISTSESQLSGLFAFSPPTASSPVRPNSCAAPKAVSVLEPSTSWSSFRLLRSKAPDVIDRMNENRSLFFDNLFKRLDKLGENSPECSTRLNGTENDTDKRSIAPHATHAEQELTPDDHREPLQHKPSLARVTGKLQQWSWIPAWVTCVVVLLIVAGVVPVAPAPLLVLS